MSNDLPPAAMLSVASAVAFASRAELHDVIAATSI